MVFFREPVCSCLHPDDWAASRARGPTDEHRTRLGSLSLAYRLRRRGYTRLRLNGISGSQRFAASNGSGWQPRVARKLADLAESHPAHSSTSPPQPTTDTLIRRGFTTRSSLVSYPIEAALSVSNPASLSHPLGRHHVTHRCPHRSHPPPPRPPCHSRLEGRHAPRFDSRDDKRPDAGATTNSPTPPT